jgi:threonine/homoserine/homoserine lactone efflux protein
VTTFRPAGLPAALGALTVAGRLVALIVPTAALWGAAGGTLGRLLTGPRTRRAAGAVMGLLLAVSVALAWV